MAQHRTRWTKMDSGLATGHPLVRRNPMPTQTELMSGAELAATRAFLGFSQAQLAEYLQSTSPKREEQPDEEPDEDDEERKQIRRELRSAATLLFAHGQP